ncbi:hypothetical protein [Roseateles albus]|uniref:Uncharacterized protein n=1 Tax=Roseateles albus TaxID=2987525 RepID=A0ABT5KHK4_9BURK|nr:hypothetical protein [Roseateles albus]MDC8773346.1 hypothetical protein [Roseateles albus]
MHDFNSIPDDFPRHPSLGSVSGAQSKICVRLIDGKYIEGETNDELFERFDNCRDLVEQLDAYCCRKLLTRPQMELSALLSGVRKSVGQKGWDVTPAELDWIMSKLAQRLKLPPTDQI